MSKEMRIEIVEKILFEHMNDTLDSWSDDAEKLNTYAWGWRDDQTVGNNHGQTFYYADNVIKTLEALELNWHLTLADNEDGEPTPCIHYF